MRNWRWTPPEHRVLFVLILVLDQIGVNACPVVDDTGALAGIVNRKDLLSDRAAGATADAVMARRVTTIFADQTLDGALPRMGRHGIRQLPVVMRGESRALIGIITLRDIAACARAAHRSSSRREGATASRSG
jgi:CBS domain-containing protein